MHMQLIRKRTMGHLAPLMATVLFAVACGTPASVATPAPTPGSAAFAVVTTAPANGATEVAHGATVAITFSAPVNSMPGDIRNPCWGAGAPGGNIQIAPAPVGAWMCAITGAGSTVVVSGVPAGAVWLQGATRYTITVAPRVSSATGVALGAPFAFAFTTGPSQVVSLPLALIPGSVGYAFNPGSALGAGIFPYVGDCETAAAPPPCSGAAAPFPHRVRAFAAFELPPALLSVPGSAIRSAVLVVTLGAVSTPSDFFAPAAGGGPIMVERVDYLDNGTLDQGDYSTAAVGAPVLAIGGYALGPHSVTITGLIQSALASPPSSPRVQAYLGLRFYWATMRAGIENTDGNGDNDIATLGRTLTLAVSYGN